MYLLTVSYDYIIIWCGNYKLRCFNMGNPILPRHRERTQQSMLLHLGCRSRCPYHNITVRGNTGLVPPTCRQYQEVASQYARITQMSPDRINHEVFIWASGRPTARTRGWPGRVHKMLTSFNLITDTEPQNNSL